MRRVSICNRVATVKRMKLKFIFNFRNITAIPRPCLPFPCEKAGDLQPVVKFGIERYIAEHPVAARGPKLSPTNKKPDPWGSG